MPKGNHHPEYFYRVSWRRVPMFKVACGFVPGLLTGFEIGGLALPAALIAIAGSVIASIHLSFDYRSARWPVILIAAFACGSSLGSASKGRSIYAEQTPLESSSGFTGYVSDLAETDYGYRAVISVSIRGIPQTFARHAPQVVTYIKCDQRCKNLRPGDELAIVARPKKLIPMRYPMGFDLAKYYARRRVFHTAWVVCADVEVVGSQQSSLKRFAFNSRKAISVVLSRHIRDTTALAITRAMLLGEKSSLPSGTRRAFQDSGTIHVLAISGLHIGIIASVLILVIGRLNPHRSVLIAVLKGVLITLAIWSYTLLSGASPSAVRASAMFSLLIIGRILLRKTEVLNVLGAVAILALCHDPGLIHDLSFQFSFMALLGIVVFARWIYNLLNTRNRIVDYAWAIVAVSVSAQFALAPLTILYFNQVSFISPFTSIIAIPYAYLEVVAGILILACSSLLPVLADFLGMILSHVTASVTLVLSAAAELPGSSNRSVYLETTGVLLAFAIALAAKARLLSGSKYATLVLVGSLLLMAVECTTSSREQDIVLTIYPHRPMLHFEIFYQRASYSNFNIKDLGEFQSRMVHTNRIRHRVRHFRHISELGNGCAGAVSSEKTCQTVIVRSRVLSIVHTRSATDLDYLLMGANMPTATVVVDGGIDHEALDLYPHNQTPWTIHNLNTLGPYQVILN